MLTLTKMFGCAVSENFFLIYNYIISRRVFINNRFRAVYVLIFSLAYPAAFSHCLRGGGDAYPASFSHCLRGGSDHIPPPSVAVSVRQRFNVKGGV